MIDLYKPCPRCGNASEKETLEFIADQYSYKSSVTHHSRGKTHKEDITSSLKIDKAIELEPISPSTPTDATLVLACITCVFVLLVIWQLLNPARTQALLEFSLLGIFFLLLSLISYFVTKILKQKHLHKMIQYQKDFEIWQRKLYCNKCGNIFDSAI